ncbi:electron transfer flavoprotein subunit beta/FixA family protein [Actinomadura chibensis]|uniref:Electron transfer flavoprotein beta subunit/FixA family protein n=1 Tax=Actinomadura chibensis TaxID=392828 RepID=A0A5D0ND02_9ACTN|nr:electron transfer flavoprotein beta subunit/FixA family protein [Actinomadura chibensis]TYB42222.1 electron transfer flavoprotein beta subunit/FixA family protein [Actinomadura chibensis]
MHLTILVPVKDVPARLRLSGGALTGHGVPHRLDPVHEVPLEWARLLRDGGAAVRVVAMTLGPPGATGALQRALALGADSIVRVGDDAPAGADVRATARAIAAVATRVGADLVACGYESADGSSGTVPAAVAACLGVPLLSRAGQAALDGGTLTVVRDLGGGPERVTAPLPAVVSFVEGVIEPRRPALRELLRTKSAAPTALSADDLGLRLPEEAVRDVRVVKAEVPERAASVMGFDEGVDALLALLAGEASGA